MFSSAQTLLPEFERVYRGQLDFVLRTLQALSVPESGLDDAMERARASDVLQRFLADLDEDRRRAFVLAELWEMSGREIAESLGINMNTVYARTRSARSELDHVAYRMHVRDAGAVTRSLRDQRASAGTRERARAGVLAAVGSSASSGAAGLATLAWAGLGAAVCGLGVVAAVTLSAPETSSPHPSVVPAASAVAPVEAASTPPVVIAAASVTPPPSPVARAQPSPKPKLADPIAPSLSEQLAAVQEIRVAVQAEDARRARAKIATHRKEVPGGALMDEVDALDIELACRTGAPHAATQLRVFAQGHRGSALVDRLTVLCFRKIGPQETSSPGTQGP